MFLSGGDGASNHLKDVFGSAAAAILNPDRDGENPCSAKLTCGDGRDLSNQAAVGEAARANFYRFEKTRKGAACTDCIHEQALREDDGIEGGEVCSNHSHWDTKVLELARFENAVH